MASAGVVTSASLFCDKNSLSQPSCPVRAMPLHGRIYSISAFIVILLILFLILWKVDLEPVPKDKAKIADCWQDLVLSVVRCFNSSLLTSAVESLQTMKKQCAAVAFGFATYGAYGCIVVGGVILRGFEGHLIWTWLELQTWKAFRIRWLIVQLSRI